MKELNPWPPSDNTVEWNPPEAFIEDCLFRRSGQILQHLPEDKRTGRVHRQRSINGAGIADLVIFTPGAISVVEIKRHIIDEGAVAQCLRYMGGLLAELQTADRIDESGSGFRPKDVVVYGVLCAPNITHGASLAMAACRARLFFYECTPTVSVGDCLGATPDYFDANADEANNLWSEVLEVSAVAPSEVNASL